MNCRAMLDKIYEFDGEKPLPLGVRLQVSIHLLLCPRCAEQAVRLEAARNIMRADFFPPAPDLSDAIMDNTFAEAFDDLADMPFDSEELSPAIPFGGWVFTGFIVLLSLASAFIGMDFVTVAAAQGSSFLLPVGITIGVVITGYGALFIGSHLKELSDRFRLH
jgi:hypothetical protein